MVLARQQRHRLWLRVVVAGVVALVGAPLHSGAVAAAAVGSLKIVDVWTGGEHGYSCFRVPSLVQHGASGRLLAFCEARRGSCNDQAPKDVLMKASDDGGATWSSATMLAGGDAGTNHTFRNPYATVEAASGAVIVQFVNSTVPEPWTNLQRVSVDGGTSWGEVQVVRGLPAPVEGVLPGPGDGIQLASAAHKGRLVGCGATGYHAGHAMETVLWYSDDGGKTYTVSSTTFPNFQECQVTELASGHVMVNMRNSHLNACDCRGVSVSSDGGATWGPVTWASALVEPVCSAGLITFPPASPNLYFSNPASKAQRVNMTVRWSGDSGQTWPDATSVWSGPSAYSVLTGMSVNGTASAVGLMFERGNSSPYEHLSFVTLPLHT